MMPYLNFHMYTYEAAKQACGNVAGLIQWTISMVAFYEINKDVLPLKVFLINKHYCGMRAANVILWLVAKKYPIPNYNTYLYLFSSLNF